MIKKKDVNGITIKSTLALKLHPSAQIFFSLRSPSAMDCPFEITKNYMLIFASIRNCNFFLKRKKESSYKNGQRSTFREPHLMSRVGYHAHSTWI